MPACFPKGRIVARLNKQLLQWYVNARYLTRDYIFLFEEKRRGLQFLLFLKYSIKYAGIFLFSFIQERSQHQLHYL